MVSSVKFYFIIFTVFILFTFNLVAIAGNNIPSDKEIAYAKQIYQLIKDFDIKEKQFLADMKGQDHSNTLLMKEMFRKKFLYTRNFYTSLSKVTPTTKFVNNKQKLVQAIYKNLQHLQKMLAEMDKGTSIKEVNSMYKSEFQAVIKDYDLAMKEFTEIVNSWKDSYVKAVIPPKSSPDNP